MAQDRPVDVVRAQIPHRLVHRLGQPRDGHADIGDDGPAPGARGEDGVIGVVPHRPQRGPILGPVGPFKADAAVVGHDVAKASRLFHHAAGRAVEFDQKMGPFGQRGARVGVDRPYGGRIDEFDAGHRNAQLDGVDHRRDGAVDPVEGADRRADRLGLAVQPQGQFGDQAQRALGPDEQARQVIARRAFPGAGAGADDPSVRQHHLKAQHVVAHRAIAHRRRPAGPGRGHAAKRGVGAGIDGKEQAGGAQFLVQAFARDAGLDPDIHVGVVDGDHPVHPAEIDDQPAPDRLALPLERGSGAPAGDGTAVGGADAHDLGHHVGALGIDHRIRRGVGKIAFATAVQVQIGLGPRERIA